MADELPEGKQITTTADTAAQINELLGAALLSLNEAGLSDDELFKVHPALDLIRSAQAEALATKLAPEE